MFADLHHLYVYMPGGQGEAEHSHPPGAPAAVFVCNPSCIPDDSFCMTLQAQLVPQLLAVLSQLAQRTYLPGPTPDEGLPGLQPLDEVRKALLRAAANLPSSSTGLQLLLAACVPTCGLCS